MMQNNTYHLTARELQVLQLIADGLTDEQISAELQFSIHNANAFRKKLLEKMQASNVADMVAKAFRNGFIK